MTDKPLVSAIVATYNRADIVGRAIESILGQTYMNIEVLVVDDGSTDGTHEALRRFGIGSEWCGRKMLDLELPGIAESKLPVESSSRFRIQTISGCPPSWSGR